MLTTIFERLDSIVHNLTWPFKPLGVSREVHDDVTAVAATLAGGARRLAPSPVALSLAWFPGAAKDVFYDEQIASDYGVPTQFKEVEAAFYEEVTALAHAIEDSSSSDDPVTRLDFGVAKRAHAMANWGRFGLPIRVHGSTVFHIRPPRDLLGSPVISTMGVDEFVAALALRTAEDSYRIMQLRAQRTVLGVISVLLAAIIVW
jgi:hypothetical protein